MSNEFKLCSKRKKATTPISNDFIDKYMIDAHGEFVKIYLYLLRCINADQESLSISKIADVFKNTENDVNRALKYWEKMKLLSLEYTNDNKISSISILEAPQNESEDSIQIKETECNADNKLSASDTYSLDELKCFSEQKDIKQLLFITEQYLGKTLTPTEISKILYFYDTLNFPADLIEYLIEYCVCKGHKNIRYIEKTALEWHKNGINTLQLAKAANDTFSQLYNTVMKSLGISGRSLIDTEKEYIKKWANTYHFSNELIAKACERTILTIQKPSFEYTDTILKNWFKENVKTIADVMEMDNKHQKSVLKKDKPIITINTGNKFNNFKQRSYDYSALERRIINSSGK